MTGNHWSDWLIPSEAEGPPVPCVPTRRYYMERIVRAFNLPARVVLAPLPPVPAKAAHRRRSGR